MTDKHWCPVCHCEADPGYQFPAIVANNLRLIGELTKVKKLKGELFQALNRLIAAIAKPVDEPPDRVEFVEALDAARGVILKVIEEERK